MQVPSNKFQSSVVSGVVDCFGKSCSESSSISSNRLKTSIEGEILRNPKLSHCEYEKAKVFVFEG